MNNLEKLKTKRKEMNKHYIIFGTTIFLNVFLLIISICFSKYESAIIPIIIFSASLVIIIILAIYHLSHDNSIYSKLMKTYIDESIPGYKFIPKNYYNVQDFYDMEFTTKKTNNQFICNNTIINDEGASSYVNCYYIISNGKSSTKITIFDGRIYEINIENKITGKVVIKEESNHSAKPKNLQKVEFESIEFNKKYNVYSTNETEAFLKIKPQQFFKIDELDEKFDGKLFICITPNKLYFGINNQNKGFDYKHVIIDEISDHLNKEMDKLDYFKNLF